MGIMKETDSRFVNLEKKLGVFVLLAIVGITLLIVFISLRQDIFAAKTRLFLIADSGKDISEGMAVKFSGFKIGKVKRLTLDDIARVKVEISINKNYMKWIKGDSRARLSREGLIGESIIEITPGSADAAQVEEEGIIPFERERGLGEVAEEVRDEIKILLADVKEVIGYINDPEGEIKSTLKNVNRFSEDIHVTRKKVDDLLENMDEKLDGTFSKVDSLLDSTTQTVSGADNVINRTEDVLESARQTLTRADDLIGGVEDDYHDISEMARESLENIRKITEELRKATEEAAPEIPALVDRGSDIADGAKEITDSVKKTWPIRSYIESPREKRLKVDSYE